MPCHVPATVPCGKIWACCMPRCKACCMPRCISSLRRLCCLLGTRNHTRVQWHQHCTDSETEGAVLDHCIVRQTLPWTGGGRKARQERTALSTATMLRGNTVFDS